MRTFTILHLLPSLNLMGGTAAKVKILVENSKYKHVICVPPLPRGVPIEWQSNCTIEEGLIRANPIKNVAYLSKIIKKYNVNIIHTYFNIDTFSVTLLKFIHPSIKSIRSFEGVIVERISILKKIIFNNVWKSCDEVIYISRYVQDFYSGNFPSLKDKKSVVVYNTYARREQQNNSILFHDVKTRILVCVSGLCYAKNLLVLIDAIKILVERGSDVRLYILGEGPYRERLELKIKEYNIQPNVILVGYTDDVITYLDKASIYVHPAHIEGFGMAVVEAMNRYCASIVSAAGALPEIITDGQEGLVVDPFSPNAWADSIDKLLSSQDLVNTMGKRAHMMVEKKFSIHNYVTGIDHIYENYLE